MTTFRLTRFDFDAGDFLASEDVAAMTASEVGQYVLLLCHAWLGGKDATLSNDPKILARLARATSGRVSPKVMGKFISTAGGRLENLRLTEEWKAACARAQVRRDKAVKAAKCSWTDTARSRRQAVPDKCSAHCSEMPSSSIPIPSPYPGDENHHDDDWRNQLFRAKERYLAKCAGDTSQIDFALTRIIERAAGPVSAPERFFEIALARFFDPGNQQDRELLQQFVVRQ
jgi:uncharacterized protein YdaU (DUF1376 family)